MIDARRDARPDAGFTLIEIIAALVVFGFLIAGLAQGVRFGLTAWRLQTQTVNRDADLDVADRLLSTLLTAIVPVGGTESPSVIGTSDKLVFTTSLPVRIGEPPTNLADARLALDSGRLTLDLVAHIHALRIGRPPPPIRTVLASGVRAIVFGYWRRTDGRWLTAWKADQPPGLVRLTIEFEGDRHWAPLVAKPILSRYDQ